ncbi:MAG: hypothetical protein RL648_54 [Verrucomicrobiota bacterium]
MVPSLGNYSAYTFHGSVWRVEELVRAACGLGYGAVGLADVGGFYGGVELSRACEGAGVVFVLGMRLRVRNFAPGWLQFTVRDGLGYRELCGLVSGACGGEIDLEDVAALQGEAGGSIWLSCPIRLEADYLGRGGVFGRWQGAVEPLLEAGWSNFWIELGWHSPAEHLLQRRVYADLSGRGWERWVLMTGARYAEGGEGERLFELTQSIGTLTRVGQRHPDKVSGGGYFLMEADKWKGRFQKVPGVLESTRAFVRGCRFEYRYGRLHLPNPLRASGGALRDREAEDRLLRWKCLRGLVKRYGEAYPWREKPSRAALLERLERELEIVSQTGYAGYFLVFAEVVDYCRRRNIPLLARGSAAGSLICHCLGVSNVCPFRFALSFERFLNRERLRHRKLPDIDLDLPWDRREEVMKWIYGRYGEDRVAMIGGFAHYQGRSAVVEVAKALGVAAHEAHAWSKRLPHGSLQRYLGDMEGHVEASAALKDDRFLAVLRAAEALEGLPRHPMMHPCGMVIADRPIVEFSPVQRSANGFRMTQLAMEPVEELGLLKLDLLGQAGLSVIRDCLDNLLQEGLVEPFTSSGCGPLEGFFKTVDYAEASIFEMIRAGGARGVFHIESPAMTSLLRLCRCADIDCLVATVSLIRPGAANEDKKTRFARRYLGLEAPVYAHPVLEEILRDSFGLMIYEEHILLVAHRFAGMDLGKADQLRRVLIKKSDGADLESLAVLFAATARRNGRGESEIKRVWKELLDFSGFMFNKAHGAAYAVEAYHGCWLKSRWPLVFLAAVLNNERGFYRPLVYVMEVLRHGGCLELPDIQEKQHGWHVKGQAVRIPVRQVKGLGAGFQDRLRSSRAEGPFRTWADFLRRARPSRAEALALARVGALRCFWRNRHEAVWEAGRIASRGGTEMELFEAGSERVAHSLSEMSDEACAMAEAELLGFPVTLTPWALWMAEVDRAGAVPLAELEQQVGRVVRVAGIQVCQRLHRTLGGKLMKFVSLADESGIAEMCLFPDEYRRHGWYLSQHAAICARVSVEWDDTQSGLSLRVEDVLEA